MTQNITPKKSAGKPKPINYIMIPIDLGLSAEANPLKTRISNLLHLENRPLTYREIADELDVPLSQIHSRVPEIVREMPWIKKQGSSLALDWRGYPDLSEKSRAAIQKRTGRLVKTVKEFKSLCDDRAWSDVTVRLTGEEFALFERHDGFREARFWRTALPTAIKKAKLDEAIKPLAEGQGMNAVDAAICYIAEALVRYDASPRKGPIKSITGLALALVEKFASKAVDGVENVTAGQVGSLDRGHLPTLAARLSGDENEEADDEVTSDPEPDLDALLSDLDEAPARNEVEAQPEPEEPKTMASDRIEEARRKRMTERSAEAHAEIAAMLDEPAAPAPTVKPHERRSTRHDGSMGLTGGDVPAAPRNLDAEEAEFEKRWAESQARRAAERAATAAPEPSSTPPESEWVTDDEDPWERDDDAFPAAAE